jgi:hypothetical protein
MMAAFAVPTPAVAKRSMRSLASERQFTTNIARQDESGKRIIAVYPTILVTAQHHC